MSLPMFLVNQFSQKVTKLVYLSTVLPCITLKLEKINQDRHYIALHCILISKSNKKDPQFSYSGIHKFSNCVLLVPVSNKGPASTSCPRAQLRFWRPSSSTPLYKQKTSRLINSELCLKYGKNIMQCGETHMKKQTSNSINLSYY